MHEEGDRLCCPSAMHTPLRFYLVYNRHSGMSCTNSLRSAQEQPEFVSPASTKHSVFPSDCSESVVKPGQTSSDSCISTLDLFPHLPNTRCFTARYIRLSKSRSFEAKFLQPPVRPKRDPERCCINVISLARPPRFDDCLCLRRTLVSLIFCSSEAGVGPAGPLKTLRNTSTAPSSSLGATKLEIARRVGNGVRY